MLRLALQETLQGDLGLEAHLGFHTDIHQNTAIFVPLTDAIQISGTFFIVDDEGRDFVPKAFFEHQQASDTTITIFEGTDALEPDMEIQNLVEANILLCFVIFKQLINGCGDLCRRRSLAEFGRGSSFAVSGGNGSVTLMAAALAEQGGLQLLDESLRQSCTAPQSDLGSAGCLPYVRYCRPC